MKLVKKSLFDGWKILALYAYYIFSIIFLLHLALLVQYYAIFVYNSCNIWIDIENYHQKYTYNVFAIQ